MTWVLPQELTDYIIESFWDDPRTLRSCALTCRAWLFTNNSHLAAYHASRKEIRSVADLDLLSRRLSRRESRRFHRNVVELQVHEGRKGGFAHTIPFRVSGAFLPNLERLSFVSVGQTVRRVLHWHYSVSKHVGLYRRVSRLRFDHCRLPSLETLRRIVFSLPSLQSLSLNHANTEFLPSCTHSAIEDAAILRQHPKVVELQILRCTFNRPSGLRHLLQWFRPDVAGKLVFGIEMVVLSRRDIRLLRLSVWQLIAQDTQRILHGLKTRIDRLPNSIRVLLDWNAGVKRLRCSCDIRKV
ncbi:hypothetical protein DAEQUDRAFT_812653 [Daedalea quercina L-15889]|uniref:F-box domain-containing protein n=1 Tax=Daedalea quercina L-15889 TaxID=1314783 RepID=A0A165P5R1_9APHY|nr:hypothetical protein DAEQUDRAFT_812653 [Daedalea quercina L-15889]